MKMLELAQAALNSGAVLKVLYPVVNKPGVQKQKFSLICAAKFAKKFGIEELNTPYLDIIHNTPFSLESINIQAIEYQLLPPGIFLQDLISTTDLTKTFGNDFLIKDISYVYSIKNYIAEQKAALSSDVIGKLEPFSQGDLELTKAHYLVRFYPNKLVLNYSKNDIINEVKQDIIEKFFTVSDNNNIIYPGARQVGITNSQLECTDKSFISAVKKIWFSFIIKERDKLISELLERKNKLSELNLNKEDIIEYNQQYDLYVDLLNNITPSCLNNYNTVREIINFWPDIITPQPTYTYGN